MIRISILVMTLVALTIAARVGATDLDVPPGSGGTEFRRTCEPGSYLVGVHARSGDWVDSLQIACSPWNGNALGAAQVIDPPIGASKGGSPNDAFCPAGAAVVATDTVFTRTDAAGSGFLDEMGMRCTPITTSRVGGGTEYDVRLRTAGSRSTGGGFTPVTGVRPCPPDELAVGFHGRAGLFIDAIALVCDAAPAPSTTHSELGRASVGDPRFGARNRVAGATRQSDASITAETGIGRTSTDTARAKTQFGMVLPRPAAAPPSAAPAAEHFTPPTFPDGARLWACTDVGDATCDGRAAAIAYCKNLGRQGPVTSTLPRMFDRRQGTVKNVKGAACIARECPVVDDLTCSR